MRQSERKKYAYIRSLEKLVKKKRVNRDSAIKCDFRIRKQTRVKRRAGTSVYDNSKKISSSYVNDLQKI